MALRNVWCAAMLIVAILYSSSGSSFAGEIAAVASPAQSPTSAAVDLTEQGVVADGATSNTANLQRAIDQCSARGGGTLRFPAGRYLTGTIQLKSNVTLHLDKDAVLLGTTDAADYRNLDPFTAGDGVKLGYALIVAMDANHVGIEGDGEIDGQGKALAAKQHPYKVRPFLLRWIRCGNVAMTGVHLQDPGAWTDNFFQCHDVAVSGLTIRTRDSGLRNNDGIDIDSCQGVQISGCDIDSGDDAMCLKTTSLQACHDIAIAGCKLATKCNAIKLGTESIGDFEHIQVSHCEVHNTNMSGIALYDVDGAHMHGISIDDVMMDSVTVPISIRLGARLSTFRAGEKPKPVGTISDVSLQNVRVTHGGRIGFLINGIPDHPVDSLSLENIQIEVAGGGTADEALVHLPEKEAAYPEMSMFGHTLPAYGAYLRHVRGVTCKDVTITTTKPDQRPGVVLIDVAGAQPTDFQATSSN